MTNAFRLLKPKDIDKKLVIAGPSLMPGGDPDRALTLDYDDVDQAKQRAYAKKVVAVLNAHWNDAEPAKKP